MRQSGGASRSCGGRTAGGVGSFHCPVIGKNAAMAVSV